MIFVSSFMFLFGILLSLFFEVTIILICLGMILVMISGINRIGYIVYYAMLCVNTLSHKRRLQ